MRARQTILDAAPTAPVLQQPGNHRALARRRQCAATEARDRKASRGRRAAFEFRIQLADLVKKFADVFESDRPTMHIRFVRPELFGSTPILKRFIPSVQSPETNSAIDSSDCIFLKLAATQSRRRSLHSNVAGFARTRRSSRAPGGLFGWLAADILPRAQRAGRIAFGSGNVTFVFIRSMRSRLNRLAPVGHRLLCPVEIVRPDLRLNEALPAVVVLRMTLHQLAGERHRALIGVLVVTRGPVACATLFLRARLAAGNLTRRSPNRD